MEFNQEKKVQSRACDKCLTICIFIAIVVCLVVVGFGLWNEYARVNKKLQEKVADEENKIVKSGVSDKALG